MIVTTPQEVSLLDVRKEIDFCRKVNLPILGVVENMSGFVCPSCKFESTILPASTGGAEKLCLDNNVPLLGKVPLDPSVGQVQAHLSSPCLTKCLNLGEAILCFVSLLSCNTRVRV